MQQDRPHSMDANQPFDRLRGRGLFANFVAAKAERLSAEHKWERAEAPAYSVACMSAQRETAALREYKRAQQGQHTLERDSNRRSSARKTDSSSTTPWIALGGTRVPAPARETATHQRRPRDCQLLS